MKRLLIIAGSDSSGGAGVQADIKTACAIGLYPLTIITAVTAQNTKGVQHIHLVPKDSLKSQLHSILDDIHFDAVKIGMLGSMENANIVLHFVKKIKKPVILDPVMFSQSGSQLTPEDVFKELMRYVYLITPNFFEAERLTGIKIGSLTDLKKAAKALHKYSKRVLIKGGDSNIDYDLYYDGKDFYPFEINRINTKNSHGTGCSLATAISSYLVLTGDIITAIDRARAFIFSAIKNGVPLGSQFGTIDQLASLRKESLKYNHLLTLQQAYERLKELKIGKLIPEIQSNLVYSLPNPQGIMDVAGFKGRIISIGEDIYTPFFPEFGASRHIARVLLTAKSFFPELNSAMALRYDKEIIKRIKSKNFVVGYFDRKREPKEVKEREGSSLDWGVTEACKKLKKCPDFIYDEGDIGKEPVIRVLGRDPFHIIEKIKEICS